MVPAASGPSLSPASSRGIFTTDLHDGEILTELRVPSPPPHSGGAYQKMERKVGDFATAAVATFVVLNDGVCESAGIGLTSVGPVPIKATNAEEFLRGKPLDDDNIGRAAELAAEQAQPTADLRGSVEYKRGLVRTLTVRALHRSLQRAQAGR